MTRPLGTFLINFERDTDRDWNLYGLSPLRHALHSNRWKQPELEQAASEFLWGDVYKRQIKHLILRVIAPAALMAAVYPSLIKRCGACQ